jgi:hypothetical protein
VHNETQTPVSGMICEAKVISRTPGKYVLVDTETGSIYTIHRIPNNPTHGEWLRAGFVDRTRRLVYEA